MAYGKIKGKGKVPVKEKTLPQLKHYGAMILAELLHEINKITKISPSNIYLWFNLQILLFWVT